MNNHQPHTPRETDHIGSVWLRNGTAWLDAPMGRTTGRYAGKHVTTEHGEGVILSLTGQSVVIGLLNPRIGEAPISIVRGTHGWDRFVDANPEVFS